MYPYRLCILAVEFLITKLGWCVQMSRANVGSLIVLDDTAAGGDAAAAIRGIFTERGTALRRGISYNNCHTLGHPCLQARLFLFLYLTALLCHRPQTT